MQKIKRIKIDERELTVKELTVGQIRNIIEDLENPENVHIIDMLFGDEIPALAVSESTEISMKDLEKGKITPSEMEIIIKGVKEVNPFFVKMIERLAKIGETALKGRTSTESSAG